MRCPNCNDKLIEIPKLGSHYTHYCENGWCQMLYRDEDLQEKNCSEQPAMAKSGPKTSS